MRADGVVSVNGKVHAICRATRKPTIFQVNPEHFEKCPHCTVYSETKEWEDAQTRAVFSTGLENTIVCGVSCPRCLGYKGRLFHSQGCRIPRKYPYYHNGWPDPASGL